MSREAERYQSRKAAGLCVYSGCTKPTDGLRACKEHREYYNTARRRHRVQAKKLRDRRRAGLVEREAALKKIGELVSEYDADRLMRLTDEVRRLVETVRGEKRHALE